MGDSVPEFIPPSEAPVFEPSWEEFQNPLQYIAKIKPIAEKSGICKIKPPARWQPPFAVNVDTFRFVPRLQRLNELEANSRVKLNFLDRLAKFWELQGSPLRIPSLDRKYIDIYKLQKVVTAEGGFNVTCKEKKWAKIVALLGYPTGRGIGSTLRSHYEHILYPYDLFVSGTSTDINKVRELQTIRTLKNEEKRADEDYTPNKKGPEDPARRPTRLSKSEPQIDYSINSELKKLQFFGPGPKMAVPDSDDADGEGTDGSKKREKPVPAYADLYHCRICNRGDGEEDMLLCDGCDDAFHTYCLVPIVTEIPKGDWRCPKCVAMLCDKPVEAYGFEQSKKKKVPTATLR